MTGVTLTLVSENLGRKVLSWRSWFLPLVFETPAAIHPGQGCGLRAFAMENQSWGMLGSVLFCADTHTPQGVWSKWGAQLHHPQGKRPWSIMLSQPQALPTPARSACTPPLLTSPYPCKIKGFLHPGREGRQHAMFLGLFKHLSKRMSWCYRN